MPPLDELLNPPQPNPQTKPGKNKSYVERFNGHNAQDEKLDELIHKKKLEDHAQRLNTLLESHSGDTIQAKDSDKENAALINAKRASLSAPLVTRFEMSASDYMLAAEREKIAQQRLETLKKLKPTTTTTPSDYLDVITTIKQLLEDRRYLRRIKKMLEGQESFADTIGSYKLINWFYTSKDYFRAREKYAEAQTEYKKAKKAAKENRITATALEEAQNKYYQCWKDLTKDTDDRLKTTEDALYKKLDSHPELTKLCTALAIAENINARLEALDKKHTQLQLLAENEVQHWGSKHAAEFPSFTKLQAHEDNLVEILCRCEEHLRTLILEAEKLDTELTSFQQEVDAQLESNKANTNADLRNAQKAILESTKESITKEMARIKEEIDIFKNRLGEKINRVNDDDELASATGLSGLFIKAKIRLSRAAHVSRLETDEGKTERYYSQPAYLPQLEVNKKQVKLDSYFFNSVTYNAPDGDDGKGSISMAIGFFVIGASARRAVVARFFKNCLSHGADFLDEKNDFKRTIEIDQCPKDYKYIIDMQVIAGVLMIELAGAKLKYEETDKTKAYEKDTIEWMEGMIEDFTKKTGKGKDEFRFYFLKEYMGMRKFDALKYVKEADKEFQSVNRPIVISTNNQTQSTDDEKKNEKDPLLISTHSSAPAYTPV
jgi:hypothetical protein